MKKIIFFLFFLLIGIERLYYFQNGGFSLTKVTSPVPPLTSLPSLERENVIHSLLNQSFRFLGSGGTSFVFLGEDGTTVLKLFKHQHLVTNPLFFHWALPGIYDTWRIERILQCEKRHQHKRRTFFFNSCTLAHQYLKEDTGLLFLCLRPTLSFAQQVKLIDAWGIPHYLDLSQTEFALQQKADLLFPYLEQLLTKGQTKKAQEAIDSLLMLIRRRCEKGIGDRDPNLWINFGFVNNKAIEFDLGSYFLNPALKHPFAISKELFFSTTALHKWLEQRSPELLAYLLQQIVLLRTDSPGKTRERPFRSAS